MYVGFGSGYSTVRSAWRSYRRHLDDNEDNGEWHGGRRYYAENWPLFGRLHKLVKGAERAQDYYDRTGVDDHYADRYAQDAIGSMVSDLSAPIPGLKLPTMAKSLAKMYGAEVELNIAKYRHATQIARRYEQNRWFEYQRRKKYNDW